MAEPQNRRQFRDYILRRLGAPVQQINVDMEQVEDRIDDALNYFYDYHYLGSDNTFYTHKVTEQDVKNRSIEIPENIISVSRVFPISNSGSVDPLFNVQRYINYDALSTMASGSFVSYYLGMTRLEDLNQMLNTAPSLAFNRHRNTLTLNANWGTSLRAGQMVLLDAVAILDPITYKDIWKDRWLKTYATALVKRQWGENVKIFGGVQLLGGLSIDGKTMYDEAVEEIRQLEEKMLSAYSIPPMDEIA